MRNRLPSMMSLRAFEAATRHLSFTRAAIELNLTQTAISHQIKNLEDFLKAKVFVRSGNMIALTEVGEEYLRSVRIAIGELSVATDRATDRSDENRLTVQCLGLFAIKRLLPHLHDFRSQHPSISLKLRTMHLFENHFHHDFDVAIWHGSGDWTGMAAERLADEEIFPVCSPRLLKDSARLNLADDLKHHTIIRTASPILRDEWPFWLETANASEMRFQSEFTCDNMVTSHQAALEGLGVTLGRSSVVGPDLAAGRLIEPFAIRANSMFSYHVVWPASSSVHRKVQLFKSWLIKRVGAELKAELK
jgi:LysR family transcriptional regulator, glycine cleavage system transcriptional activator